MRETLTERCRIFAATEDVVLVSFRGGENSLRFLLCDSHFFIVVVVFSFAGSLFAIFCVATSASTITMVMVWFNVVSVEV